LLDARLSPLLDRVYGVTRDAVRANDMFVVRYDGEGQNSLGMHTDSSHISFNVLLNDEFEGGGTRFHNRLTGTYDDAKLTPGQVLINNAMVTHEGLPTTKGIRYIFVGFMNVDRKDPWTHVTKDVSWFSTYLSFPWIAVTLKEALMVKKSDSRNSNAILSKSGIISRLLTKSVRHFGGFGDSFSPHGVVSLVKDEDAEEYIETLDSFHEAYGSRLVKSRWYSGQQIYLGFDGTFQENWESRGKEPDKFKEDLL